MPRQQQRRTHTTPRPAQRSLKPGATAGLLPRRTSSTHQPTVGTLALQRSSRLPWRTRRFRRGRPPSAPPSDAPAPASPGRSESTGTGSQTIELVRSSGASRDAAYQRSSGASDCVARRPLLRFVRCDSHPTAGRAPARASMRQRRLPPARLRCRCSDSSNSAAHGAPNNGLGTLPFVEEQQSGPALPLLVPGSSERGGARRYRSAPRAIIDWVLDSGRL
jgi:hypothetical protein